MDQLMCKAWREAAVDLGIRVIAPVLVTLADGRLMAAEAHVLDFGSPKGAVAISADNPLASDHRQIGYWVSTLYAAYRAYDRGLFVDTLNDWGWFGGEEDRPDWYTGRPWSP